MIEVIFTVETHEQADAIIEVVSMAELDSLDFAFSTRREDTVTGEIDDLG